MGPDGDYKGRRQEPDPWEVNGGCRVIDEFLISPERLERLGSSLAPVYAAAQPFPHIVMDDFLPVAAAEEILGQFPAGQDEIWNRNYHSNSKKLATNDLDVMPDRIRGCLLYLN